MKYSLADMRCHPFCRGPWHGKLFTTDNAPTEDFQEKDLSEVLWYYDTGNGWDGSCAGLARLKDGRYVSWETSWGPTGDGFSEDAYGCDADILCSRTIRTALLHGFTPDIRNLASKALGVCFSRKALK